MTTIPYLKYTKNGYFKYRRRVPKQLETYFNSSEVIKSLGNNQTEATKEALEITSILNEASELTNLSSIPKKIILDLLSNKLQLGDSISNPQVQNQSWLSSIVILYLEQSNVTTLEYSKRVYFFQSLLPSLIEVLFNEKDININFLTYEKILKIRKILVLMPNMNYGNFKLMDLTALVSSIHKGLRIVPPNHLVSTTTVNKNLKRIKTILLFAQDLGLYPNVIPKGITMQPTETSSRNYKSILSSSELNEMFTNTPDDIQYIYEVLYYTGMRRSELYKCDVVKVEGILCFDLRSTTSKLKTKSSYRVIPVHDKLIHRIDEFKILMLRIKPQRLTKSFTRIAKKVLDNTEGKSLYSLRHTFATNLIGKEVQAEVVSELMGHSHSTITMNRYVKGYPTKLLQEAVNKL